MRNRGMRRHTPRAGLVALVLAVGGTLAGCAELSAAGSEPASQPTAVPSTPAAASPASVVVVGDSLAAGEGFDATLQDPGSWKMFLEGDFEVTGGWWRNGATTEVMADNLELSRGDVLVVMGGTNDASRGVKVDVTVRSVKRIVEKVQADSVILCAIPPLTADPEAATEVNDELETLAAESGWLWLDPWDLYRDGEDWTTGASFDGLHAGLPAYRSAGLVISQAISSVSVPRVG